MSLETIEGFALSLQQRRLWRLHNGTAGASAYCELFLKGHLSVARLKASVETLIDRNEILRTRLGLLSGMKFPILVVTDKGGAAWREIDLSQDDPLTIAETIKELQTDARASSLGLESELLLQITLVALSADEHLLLATLPSLCADSSTLKSFVRQMAGAYEEDRGDAAETPQIIQYSQYAEWQRQLLDSEEATLGKEFWRFQQFSQSSQPYVSFEEEISESAKFSPTNLKLSLPVASWTTLMAIAEEWNVSADDFLLALWHTLIWRLTGRDETTAGRIVSGREHEALLDVFGPISKCLPTVVRFSPSMPLSSLVRQLALSKSAMIEGSEYFDFDEYQIDRGRTPNAGEARFLTFGFAFEEWPSEVKAADLEISIRSHYACCEPFRVMLSVTRYENSLLAELVYDAARVRAAKAAYVAGLFETLFNYAIANPTARLGDLEVLFGNERRHLLPFDQVEFKEEEWGSVIEELEAQVARGPDEVAVVSGEEQLTYREMNERANQLGRYLLRAGVAREERVGILLERSVAMIWAMVGVLKAGAAYVPLEVMNPVARVKEMIADGEIGIVLSTEKWRSTLAEAGVRAICVDGAEGAAVAEEKVEAVGEKLAAENLAYVIYTSGSTGKPKGVMIQHGSLNNLARALNRSIYEELGIHLRVSLNAPLTFDASVKQWLQLLNGHTLDILPEHVRYDAEELLAYAGSHKIDVLDCTPAQLTSLIAAGLLDKEDVPFSAVLVGGDKLDEKTWRLLAQSGVTRFYNVYGPTECTVDTTICSIQNSHTASLGVPIVNASVYLLDETLRHVPLEVTGEIHIGGDGVSRGYLGQPALTAARFIPDPFADKPGSRMYRSGDLARYSPPALEFLGRKDRQVKIRGFRVELEEIEAVLKLHESVREVAVVVGEESGDKGLVAYAVLQGEQSRSQDPAGNLRRFLRERLPEFMIPVAFVILDSFPLNAHGKVDRAALPAQREISPSTSSYIAPRNAHERLIAAIWREVLGRDRIGINDNFFDLGGHSLLLTRAYGKLREAVTTDFSMIELFKYPTVSSLAEFLTAGSEPDETATAGAIQQRVEKQRAALENQRRIMPGRRDH